MRVSALIVPAIVTALLGIRPVCAVEIGVYAGPGCAGVTHLGVYQAWLGSPATHVTENFDQSSWFNLTSDVPWSVNCYASVRNAVSMTFSIPMLPADGISSLAAGALGAYDNTFTVIANTLINAGFSTAIVRLGWEFNGNWQPWFAGASPANTAAFIAYYQRIVTLMKAVPGARFLFEWCPNVGAVNMPADQGYPGDAFVDVVGMDIYDGHWSAGDANPAARWNYYVTESYGLQWQVNFAAAHMKRLSLPEWGCCGNNTGDDPYFINQMSIWLTKNSYLYAVYWDSNSAYRGMLSNNQYPSASVTYIQDFRER
jgi:Glycosyl hydrolase family 26